MVHINSLLFICFSPCVAFVFTLLKFFLTEDLGFILIGFVALFLYSYAFSVLFNNTVLIPRS